MRRDDIELPEPDGYGAAYKPFEQGRAPCIRRFQPGGRMKSCVGELTCIPSHGNAEDSGLCGRCEDAAIEAREKRERKLSAALGAYFVHLANVRDDAMPKVLEKLIEAVTEKHYDLPDTCLLCGWTDGCKPGCATEALTELID